MTTPRYRYSRWDGSQSEFTIAADDLLEQLTDDMFRQNDVMTAMKELFRRGIHKRNNDRVQGLQEFLQQLRRHRKQKLERYNIDSVVDDLRKRIDEVVRTERQGIRKSLYEASQKLGDSVDQTHQRVAVNLGKLDLISDNVAGAIKELEDYDFMDSKARQMHQEILNMLKQQIVDHTSQDIKMLRELTHMLREELMGLKPDYRELLDKFGSMFGSISSPTLDDFIEHIEDQIIQTHALSKSMSQNIKQEFEDVMASVQSEKYKNEMSDVASLIAKLKLGKESATKHSFTGEERLDLSRATEVLKEMRAIDRLERSLRDAIQTGDLENIDPDELARWSGDGAKYSLEKLKEVKHILEEAGYMIGEDHLELTPLGIRKIGQRALVEVFSKLKKDRVGPHYISLRGSIGERLDETKPYEYGYSFDVNLPQSLKKALYRQGRGLPIRIEPSDFEVFRSEHSTQAATVVLLDQSRSMGMVESFQAAKKVAMALFSLIRSQYPRDRLFIVGFSDYAHEIKEDELLNASWNTQRPGTNLHHALMISRKLLAKEKMGTRQIILITDGEPTAYLEGDRAYFSYPPTPKTVFETLKEVKRCTQAGIIINTFMLENNYQLLNFIDNITRVNRGRAFYSSPQALGEFVLVDFVNNRQKRSN
ncbi:VWA domain-containing protein [SAR202 cluster bacterium AD-804-J14_MRT_500m]|nr:VWA domain-containing protein [SAR202 cluster bacterium AD-804-J14_MRT_500m]